MKAQNTELKKEFEKLKEKLINCLYKVNNKPQMMKVEEKSKEEVLKGHETHDGMQEIEYYKKQIEFIKNQLDTTFNMDK